MERETQTFTTPEGKELVVKAWLTAGERRKIQEVMVGSDTITADAAPKGDAIFKAQDKLIEVAIALYDGSAENVLKRLLDQRAEEMDFVTEKAGQVLVPLVEKK